MIPYTYLLKWTSIDKYYYGVRYKRGCNPADLWVTYFSSSKIVAQLVKNHGDPDIIQVRKIFKDTVAARDWEYKFLCRVNAQGSDQWLNQTNGRAIPPRYGDQNSSTLPHVRAKISLALVGKKRPDVAERNKTLKGMGIIGGRVGTHTAETKRKMSESRNKFLNTPEGQTLREKYRQRLIGQVFNRGTVRSEETKALMREQRRDQIMITNGSENRRVHKDTPIPNNWRRGCTKSPVRRSR